MTEITDFGTIVLIVTAGFALAALSTTLTERVPVPAPAIFLLAAAAVSDIWPGVYEAVPIETVERIAVVALIVILFNGGIDIGWRRFRASAAPILSLGLLGTFATAGLVAVIAHYALGFDWILAGIVGAAIAPTDPAVMFSVLGRREVGGRSGTILEGEAGVNDPAGIALMLGMIELATHDDASFLVVVREFAVEMSVGVVLGLLGAARPDTGASPRSASKRRAVPGARARPRRCALRSDLARARLGLSRGLHLGAGTGRCAHAVQGRDRALLRARSRVSPNSPSSSHSV